jgi:hypothetical protein
MIAIRPSIRAPARRTTIDAPIHVYSGTGGIAKTTFSIRREERVGFYNVKIPQYIEIYASPSQFFLIPTTYMGAQRSDISMNISSMYRLYFEKLAIKC